MASKEPPVATKLGWYHTYSSPEAREKGCPVSIALGPSEDISQPPSVEKICEECDSVHLYNQSSYMQITTPSGLRNYMENREKMNISIYPSLEDEL